MNEPLQLLVQFLLAGAGTLCFGVLFAIPRHTRPTCALTGAVGWAAYQLAVLLGADSMTASLLAVIPLTLLARLFAIGQRAPVTVFLLCGIFPLVPGAGIYYTAYYFIQGDGGRSLYHGLDTLKIAAALALGITLVLSLPLPGHRKK